MSGNELRRISTGSPGLDHILHGGLPANSLNVLMGQPGTGKTVLAEQILFANAQGDRPVLYLTTLSEPLAKVLTYLQRFTFFDPDRIGSTVHYEDVGHVLANAGIDALVEAVRNAVKEVGPALIVIDSFKVVHSLGDSESHVRRLLSELAGMLAAYDTTVILIGEYQPDDVSRLPEFAVADGVVSLTLEGTGKADHRFLRVLKLRGSGYVEGQHAFTIDRDGIRPYPRLVTPEVPEDYEPIVERVPTGVKGLDSLLGGGLWRGSTALITGSGRVGENDLRHRLLHGRSRRRRAGAAPELPGGPGTTGPKHPGARRRPGLGPRAWPSVGLRVACRAGDRQSRLIDLRGPGRRGHARGDRRRRRSRSGRTESGPLLRLRVFTHQALCRAACHHPVHPREDGRPEHRRTFGPGTIRLDDRRDHRVGVELEGEARPTLRVVKARGIAHDLNAHDIEIHEHGIRVVDVAERG